MKKITFIIGITTLIDDEFTKDLDHINEIGNFLAEDIRNSLDNCEDFLETCNMGAKIDENS